MISTTPRKLVRCSTSCRVQFRLTDISSRATAQSNIFSFSNEKHVLQCGLENYEPSPVCCLCGYCFVETEEKSFLCRAPIFPNLSTLLIILSERTAASAEMSCKSSNFGHSTTVIQVKLIKFFILFCL